MKDAELKTSTETAIELLVRTKRRWRLNQWQRDYAKLMGWKLPGRRRPKKKA